MRGLWLLCESLSPANHCGPARAFCGCGRQMCGMREVREGMSCFGDPVGGERAVKQKYWYDYLWIASVAYLLLGFFNILFAWLGLLCFFIPLLLAFFGKDKLYCNRYCGRGQLFSLLGGRFGLSRKRDVPYFLKTKAFRYGFLIFFFIMFFQMLWNTYLVFSGAQDLRQVVTLLWTFRLPWQWAYQVETVPLWVSQFAFGFYSVMLTSTVLGILTMVLFKPRSWCVYCPMGTMTQLICQVKHQEK